MLVCGDGQTSGLVGVLMKPDAKVTWIERLFAKSGATSSSYNIDSPNPHHRVLVGNISRKLSILNGSSGHKLGNYFVFASEFHSR